MEAWEIKWWVKESGMYCWKTDMIWENEHDMVKIQEEKFKWSKWCR